jgi:hypothetical protein
MTYDLPSLTATLLMNHVTVRFPLLDARRTGSAGNINKPRLSNRLTVFLHLLGIRLSLSHAGHHAFLYQLDADEADRWTIHLFLADEDAIPLVASLRNGVVERSQPASFDPREFIEQRLEHLNKSDRLAGRDPWWDDRAQAA